MKCRISVTVRQVKENYRDLGDDSFDLTPYFARVEYNERTVLGRLGGDGPSVDGRPDFDGLTALSSTSKASSSFR